MNRLKLILIGIIIFSCTGTDESIKDVLTSDNYVRWSKDQKITPDLFEGNGSEYAYSMWAGYYFIYDLRSGDLKFNVTTFMDKKKSHFDKMNELVGIDTIKFSSEMFKLRFDHYEVYARKLRKHLLDNKSSIMNESKDNIESISPKFQKAADTAWREIINDLQNNDYNLETLSQLRLEIDGRLTELKDYDSTVNNYD
jgi:hypothetical protein